MCAPNAVQLLKGAGIDFAALKNHGIDHNIFAENLFSSGFS